MNRKSVTIVKELPARCVIAMTLAAASCTTASPHSVPTGPSNAAREAASSPPTDASRVDPAPAVVASDTAAQPSTVDSPSTAPAVSSATLRPPPPPPPPAIPAAEMAQRQWSHVASIDGSACRATLASAGVRFTSVPDAAAPDKNGCGVPHGVIVTRGPTGIAYAPPLFVDCSLARELVDIERVVQEEAGEHLGAGIARIDTLGTFACRHRRGRWESTMSEHSFGVAVDFATFVPRPGARDGRAISILRDYELGKASPGPRGAFLRGVYLRLQTDTKLTFVLGPEVNPQHRDHFHIDRGYRWW